MLLKMTEFRVVRLTDELCSFFFVQKKRVPNSLTISMIASNFSSVLPRGHLKRRKHD